MANQRLLQSEKTVKYLQAVSLLQETKQYIKNTAPGTAFETLCTNGKCSLCWQWL